MKGHPCFAATYDFMMRWVEAGLLGPFRQRIVGQASGCVLEIGAGTGASFSYYRPAQRLVATEPDPFMLPRARRRARELGLQVVLVECLAEELPFPEASFDVVISTLVLCTVADPARSLSEIRRVLKPGGSLRFIEHVRFDGARGNIQDRLVPIWSYLTAGCQPNRRTVENIEAAGFAIAELQYRPTPIAPFVVGVATSAG